MSAAGEVRIQDTSDRLERMRAAVRAAARQLDEVRLPLHILLDGRFGVLSENQEELLAAARDAADGLEALLRDAGEVANACPDSTAS